MASTNSTVLFNRVQELMQEIGATKTAAAESEPTGNGAGANSASPTTNAEDNLTSATEGARANEMSSTLKGNVAASVDAAPEASTSAKEEDRQADVGITVSGVGNDPAQEDGYTDKLKEPGVGTQSKAKFEDGQKYASAEEFAARPLAERNEYLAKFANSLLADIVAQATTPATVAPKMASEAKPTETPDVVALAKEAEAGYQLAAVLHMEKLSADQRAQLTFEQVLGDASLDADLIAAYMIKKANENVDQLEHDTAAHDDNQEETNDHDSDNGGDSGGDAASGGMMPPEADGDSPDGGIPSEQSVDSALNSIGGAGAQEGAAPSQDEVLQQLLMLLMEHGISPDQLGAMAGGQGQKLASAAKDFQRQGKFEFKIATTAREKAIRNHIKSTLSEIL